MDDGHKSRLNYIKLGHSERTTQRDRLKTFSTWSLSYPDLYVLSKLGFYFTGKSDQVKCCECSQTIENWQNKTNPLLEHYKINNGCVFVQRNRDILFTFTIQADIISKSTVNKYVSIESRILSYKGVCLPAFLSVESLAHAGFYYLGPGDKVKCHCCGIILVEWETSDIPIAEHYRWSSDCNYVRQCLPQLNYDVDSFLKLELGTQQISSVITRECETRDYNLTNRESFRIPDSRNFNKNTYHNNYSNPVSDVLLNLDRNRMVKECASEPVKFPIQEGSCHDDRDRTIPESEVYDEGGHDEDELTSISAREKIETTNEIYPSNLVEESGNDEDELTKILTGAKVEAAKEIFGFPSYVIEEFVRRYYKQHHRDFDSAAQLCSALMEELEQDENGKEMCDSYSASNKAENISEISNEPKDLNPLDTVTKTNEDRPTNKTVEKTEKEERFVSSFDSKLSLNSETYVPCKICMDNEVQVTFIPCRHLVTCEKCSNLVTECPICRKHIRERMKIYLS